MQAVHDNQRPTFKDLNSVAAHALASLLLPARGRVATPAAPTLLTGQGASSPSLKDPRCPANSLRSSGSSRGPRLSAGARAAQSNSAAQLSQIPSDLGRAFTMADMLCQVQTYEYSIPHILVHMLKVFT
jgi:hypothetical protein